VSQPNFSRPGAIDLSSLRKPAAPRPGAATPGAPAAPGGAATGGAYVLNVTEPTFQADVIERSIQVPVIVEFHSPRSVRSWSSCPPSTPASSC
jgi:putative thioredoxin